MNLTPIQRLRRIGRIEGVSFLLLLIGAMPLKYLAGQPLAVKLVGWAHGILFVCFCWALFRAWRDRLPFLMVGLAFVASLLPFGPFLIDGWLKHFDHDAVPAHREATLRTVMRLLLGTAIAIPVVIGVLLGARLIFFAGPLQPRETLDGGPVIDLHCHTAGIGAGDSGCFISPELRRNFRFGIYLEGFGVTEQELESQGDQLVIGRISRLIAESEHVDRAVVLAIDGVYDDHGGLDRTRTELYVPNGFVARETARHTNLLFGASVNPHRKDALEELGRVKADGAVLVKWIPSIMLIDPSDEALRPFYRKLTELDLPLLTHGGTERSFTRARDELADPARLKLPLDMGVRVIVAHVASTGTNDGEQNFERLVRLFEQHPNLHSEISALTQVNKPGHLGRVLADDRLRGRLLFGSDYPLINTPVVSAWYFPLNLTREEMSRLEAIENPFDRNVELKLALGVPGEIFLRTAEVLRLPGAR